MPMANLRPGTIGDEGTKMSSTPSQPEKPRPGGLQGVRNWLLGMVESLKPSEPPESGEPATPAPAEGELLPTWDGPGEGAPAEPAPAPSADGTVAEAPAPVEALPVATPAEPLPVATPAEAPAPAEAIPLPKAPPAEPEPPPVALPPCPICDAPRRAGPPYCESCGYIFPPDDGRAAAPVAAAPAPAPNTAVRDRFELTQRLGERGGVERYRGVDRNTGAAVVVVRMPLPPVVEAVPVAEPTPVSELPPAFFNAPTEELPTSDEVMVSFDTPEPSSLPVTGPPEAAPAFPAPSWEERLLHLANHPFLPQVVDSFAADGFEYLIEEVPDGRPLWDAWDDPDATMEQRFGWLRHVAEQVRALHLAGALPETLRPDMVVVTADGRARLADLSDLLPLPVPPDAPIRGTLYTAPELASHGGKADARASLYSFGAMLYSLHVGRELTEMDFDRPGQPKDFVPRFPDIHPAFGRLMMKTFTRDAAARFPTDEAMREDPTGFTELIRTLEACGRTLDDCRLEIAAWTTTGMVRTGNEDAFALLHACESRQDDVGECALLLLADGMGGYEAGEIAAALAIQHLRRILVGQKPFAALAGASAFPNEVPRPEGNAPAPLKVEEAKALIRSALKETNKAVYQASRGPKPVGRRGMGCTAEVVYVDGRNVVVGHVGDSRTYHLHDGRLIQLTRDQTLVNRLVELGQLTAEEAEDHPRKNELQQAVGGQPDVEPGLYHGVLKPGDWVVVCSDGLSNHVKDRDLKQMLQSEAVSAEMAARRLVNLVNIEGATDNATVVVVRAT
jgi:serine/threonine protein phosphatase PrpC